MTRTQVMLETRLLRQARARAAERGLSLAAYVRSLISADLAGPKRVAEPSAVFNLGHSGGSNIARDKDAMIGDAVEAQHPRKTR